MISTLARQDWEDLRARGLDATLEDFDRLNSIALRLADGEETTCANFPRVAWAGDVPFFEPTFQAFAWYNGYAVRLAANTETENTFWAFALAHARTPHAFDGLRTREEIESAVAAWAESLPVTRDEVMRACRYAARGFDDADTADAHQYKHRADISAAARNLAKLEKMLAKACAVMHVPPESVQCETPTRIGMICNMAAVEMGKELVKDEAKLRVDYDLTLREIARRLTAEKKSST